MTRRSIFRRLQVASLVVAGLGLVGCKPRPLQPEQAVARLRKWGNGQDQVFGFSIGGPMADEHCEAAKARKHQGLDEVDRSAKVAVALGWTEWYCQNDRLMIRLTPQGEEQTKSGWRREPLGDGRVVLTTRLADWELVDVPRIEQPVPGYAVVHYRVRWRPTAIGKLLKAKGWPELDTPIEDQVEFEHTSSGWDFRQHPKRIQIR